MSDEQSSVEITADMGVRGLHLTTRAQTVEMNRSIESKRKSYRLVIWCATRVTVQRWLQAMAPHCDISSPQSQSLDFDLTRGGTTPGLALEQWTPFRVMHRRVSIPRTRHIQRVCIRAALDGVFASQLSGCGNSELLGQSSRCFVVDIVAEAGAYIKEFATGNRGRTTPSISSLLSNSGRIDVDVLQLDVLDVMDFRFSEP